MNLQKHISLTKEVMNAPNLAGRFGEEDLGALSSLVWSGFDKDKQSRARWEARMDAATNLAMQYTKEKTFPWPGASNIAFPLVTIAALQYHSRAYPALVPSKNIVRCRVNGPDPQGEEAARATRIGEHLSYQLMEESMSWEEDMDRALLIKAIMGCVFKKTYRNGSERRNASDLVMAQDLVFDYYASDVETCRRKTHIIPMYRNEVHEAVMAGTFLDIREEPWYQTPATPKHDVMDANRDNRLGNSPPQADEATPFTFLEQHLWVDLDGDGYEEPWIITIEYHSKKVVRIVAGWDKWTDVELNGANQVMKITRTEYFTRYMLIPSPDGGALGLGFGILLGPLNSAVDSIVNQLVDAGTMANTAGGFLARGAKIRGGSMTFSPLEWKRVDSTGDDLKKSIFPLPVREPSNVLFQLLSLLIDYTNRISGSTDMLAGMNPGQNTAAYTTDQMVEQGMQIYSAIFKRAWRSMRSEFQKLARLNSIHMGTGNVTYAEGKLVKPSDYSSDLTLITPVADPNVMSKQQRMQRAVQLKQAAATTPGYNVVEVEKRYLMALDVDNIDLIYPGPEKTGPIKNPKIQVEELRLQGKQMQMQADMQKFAADLMEQRRLNSAKIMQLEAQAAKLMAEAQGAEAGHQLAAFEAAIGAMKTHDEMLRSRIELMLQGMKLDNDAAKATSSQ